MDGLPGDPVMTKHFGGVVLTSDYAWRYSLDSRIEQKMIAIQIKAKVAPY